MEETRPLTGQVALVTGASRGIGAATAIRLAELGAAVVMAQRGDGRETADAIARHVPGIDAWHVACDLALPGAPAAAVAEAVRRAGRVDVLVANAGQIHREPALEVSVERFQEIVTLDLVAPFALAQATARHLTAAGRPGRIVMIASVLGFQGGLNVAAYAASKAGLVNLTRALANEWAPLGIAVNAVAPGYVENEQTAPVRADPERRRSLDERIPVGRWGATRRSRMPSRRSRRPRSRTCTGTRSWSTAVSWGAEAR